MFNNQKHFILTIVLLCVSTWYVSFSESGHMYRDELLVLYGVIILVALFFVFRKVIKISGISTGAYFKEWFSITHKTYDEKAAQDFIYNKLDRDMQAKFSRKRVSELLEKVYYLEHEEKIAEDRMYFSLKDEFPEFEKNDLIRIRALEIDHVRSGENNISHS